MRARPSQLRYARDPSGTEGVAKIPQLYSQLAFAIKESTFQKNTQNPEVGEKPIEVRSSKGSAHLTAPAKSLKSLAK
jgi:hypothetical protein